MSRVSLPFQIIETVNESRATREAQKMVEIWGERDAKDLVGAYATVFDRDLLSKNIEIQTKVGGVRQIRRSVPELEKEGERLRHPRVHRSAESLRAPAASSPG